MESDSDENADEDEERNTTPDDERGQRHVPHESEAVGESDHCQEDDRRHCQYAQLALGSTSL